jgi:hypothetical protein
MLAAMAVPSVDLVRDRATDLGRVVSAACTCRCGRHPLAG